MKPFSWIMLYLVVSSVYSQELPGTNKSCRIKLRYPKTSLIENIQTLDKGKSVVLVLIGFGGFSLILALLYNTIRKHIFHDSQNLDTTFDAGGRVSFSLTVVVVTSQLLWPGDFLHSSTLVSKYGLAGSLWYSVGIAFCLLVFPMMTVHLKTKAPGAKTFLQVIYARFGKPAHTIFCGMAIMASLEVIAATIISGQAVFKMVIKDISDELIMLILATLFGSYCLIGGLGTTFYISYFNTALIFSSLLYYIWVMFYSGSDQKYPTVTKESLYEALDCLEAPDSHYRNSFLTFRSFQGALNGVIVFFVATSLVYCDQANWQSRIAAKPAQGVLGFLVAGLLWFTVPSSISLTSAMTYMSMSYNNQSNILTAFEIDSGYITPYIMQTMMGSTGGYIVITMVTMALMSTGSGEVMAVSSIIVYDIYKTYVNPYRVSLTPTTCLLCGKEKLNTSVERPQQDNGTKLHCDCISVDKCHDCKRDVKLQISGQPYDIHYSCQSHGRYRHYEDLLIRLKAWCIIWVTLALIPFGLLLLSTDVNLNWMLYVLEVLLAPFLVPLLLTLTWAKTTSKGVILGSISGFIVSVLSDITVAGTYYPGGLDQFILNTGSEYSVLAGVFSGIVVSSVVCVCVSICTTTVKTTSDAEAEWEKIISIDNPLNPWKKIYEDELKMFESGTKITELQMGMIFKTPRKIAYIGGSAGLITLVIVLPGVLVSFDKFDFNNFSGWITFNHIWCLLGAIFTIIVPPVEECFQIWRKFKANKDTNGVQREEANQMFTSKC